MKFAKELERDLVPEWRIKYLDYKQGKKKLKAISRALRTVNQTPRNWRRGANLFAPSPYDTAPKYSFLNRNQNKRPSGDLGTDDLRPVATNESQRSWSARGKANGRASALAREMPRSPEEQPLKADRDIDFAHTGLTRYGSILGSPPNVEPRRAGDNRGRKAPVLELPDPALDIEQGSPHPGPATGDLQKPTKSVVLPPDSGNAFNVGKTKSPTSPSHNLPFRYRSIFSPKRVNTAPVPAGPHPFLKRVLSYGGKAMPSPEMGDVPLEAYKDVDIRQEEFFRFLDLELEKIELFYKQKEDEATERLQVLRDQLHIMRDNRIQELVTMQTSKIKKKHNLASPGEPEDLLQSRDSDDEENKSSIPGFKIFLKPVDSALEAVKAGRYGKNSKGMQMLGTPSALRPQYLPDDNRDYSRRPDLADVPYRSAKRKLKIALQEYYRGLELLKSYALLNRTAFRKINKKYDKTVNARPSGRYMTEKVNKAWFVRSDVLEGHIRVVEDLYARYFEHGNHKVAAGKLRVKSARAGEYTQSSFRNGITLAAGLVLGIQGLVNGAILLSSDDEKLHTDTSYLLQIYAGYFLMNFLFLLFCLACRVWHLSKINYTFVFEYDTRSHLDWRQLAELPCFFFFLFGLFMWLNFSRFGGESVYIYYPVILIGVTALILFFPAPIFYHRSRTWLLYSMWRLFFAGLYPVEFRDFYLGDMFCSLTYSMGNIELFFCLYANDWNNPGQCNSSHSRLLGFLATVPGIWRALQCIRRYRDTKNIFPHLVNCGKYVATILYYVTLSMYRIDKSSSYKALFISFATFNSIYTSIWDIVMDWSLGDPTNGFLRSTLGYKRKWIYYAAMVIDPILRFNWIFYAIFPIELQHSAVLSFLIAFSEVCRRGMWTLFRVENEHCTNVGLSRASRDVPLPYDVPSSHEASQDHLPEHHPSGSPPTYFNSTAADLHPTTTMSTLDLEASGTHSTVRSRRPYNRDRSNSELTATMPRGLSRMGSILHAAHAQDFERKKRGDLLNARNGAPEKTDDSDCDIDEEEEEAEEVAEFEARTGSGGEREDGTSGDEVRAARQAAEGAGNVDVDVGEGSSGG